MKDTIDVSVRRSPKYSAFILVGVAVGMIAGGIVSLLPVDTSTLPVEVTQASITWLLMVFLGIIGGFGGAILALVIDRAGIKRARTYQVTGQFRRQERVAAENTTPEVPAVSAEPAGPADPDGTADPNGATGLNAAAGPNGAVGPTNPNDASGTSRTVGE